MADQDWVPSSQVDLWRPSSAQSLDTSNPGILGSIKKKVDDFILSHVGQLSEKEPGILNPNPEQNPLLGKSFLPETKQEPGVIGAVRHGAYNVLRGLASPLNMYGMAMDVNPPKEPIGTLPKIEAPPVEAAKPAPLGLPPATPEIANARPTTFYQGRAGVTQANKTYPMDLGPVNSLPDDFYTESTPDVLDETGKVIKKDKLGGNSKYGTVLDREKGEISQIPAMQAAETEPTLGHVPDIEPSNEGVERAMKSGGKIPKPLPSEVPLDYKNKVGEDFTGTPEENPNARIFGETSQEYKTRMENPDWKPKSSQEIALGEGGPEGSTKPQGESNPEAESKIEAGIPKPGESVAPVGENQPLDTHSTTSRDINFGRAQLSVNDTLNSRPETAPIAQTIVKANDDKLKWISQTLRRFSNVISGLSTEENNALYDMLNGEKVDPKFFYLQGKAVEARAIFDDAWNMVPGAVRGEGSSIGYLEDYITRIEKDPDLKAGLQQILDWHKNPKTALEWIKDKLQPRMSAEEGTGVGDMYEKGLGNPDSRFRLKRTGEGGELEKDLKRIFPMYTESLAKLIFDKPAVDEAKAVLSKLPDTNVDGSANKLKDLAAWYIKNYTRYDATPGLTEAWKNFSQVSQRVVSRSMIGFNPGLQTMHIARIFGNLMPELPLKYMADGAKQLKLNPAGVVNEAAELGLLPNEVRPWKFKRPMEKVDSILHLFSYVDSIDRLMAYHGSKQMFLEQGADQATAAAKALQFAKKTGLSIDPARPIKFLNPEAGPAGVWWKWANQFHAVPTKIAEQYAGIAYKLAQTKDPMQAARTIFGVGSAIGLTYGFGIKTFHLKPGQFFPDFAGGPVGHELTTIGKELAHSAKSASQGDGNAAKFHFMNALKETAIILAPAGKSLESQIKRGPSLWENTPSFQRP